jgi:hypothetical protein
VSFSKGTLLRNARLLSSVHLRARRQPDATDRVTCRLARLVAWSKSFWATAAALLGAPMNEPPFPSMSGRLLSRFDKSAFKT